MTYTKQTWADGTGGGTPLSSGRLNHMEDGIALVDTKAPVLTPTATKTGAYTLAAGDFVPVDATSANVPLTLPTAPADGTRAGAKLVATASNHTATLTCGGSDKINTTTGGTTYTLSVVNQAVQFQYQASVGVWIVVASDLPLSQLDTRYLSGTTVAPWAAATVYKVGDLVTQGGRLYRRKTAGTSGSSFIASNWEQLTAAPSPLAVRPRFYTAKSDSLLLDPSTSTLGTQFVQPEQIVRDTDGVYYCSATFTKLDGTVTSGLLRCLAGLDPRDGANWTELGAFTGLPASVTGADAPHLFRYGTTWYVLVGGKATGTGVSLYKSNGGPNGTYTLTTANLIPVGAGGAFDEARATEPYYFRRTDGTHTILYMGFDSGNAHEQIGMATCPSGSNIETAANWTKAAGNPIIARGGSGTTDEFVVADPYAMEIDATVWIGYAGFGNTGVVNAAHHAEMFATTSDWTTVTKNPYPLQEDFGMWPNDGAPNTLHGVSRLGPNWRGHWFRLGAEYDYDVLWPYGASYGAFASTQRRVQARMSVIPLDCFRQVPTKNPWVKLQSDTTDGRVSKTGTWTLSTNTYYDGGTAHFSNTAGDRFRCDFRGSGVRVRSQCRNNSGIANVYIDGSLVATIDMYQIGDTSGNPWSVLMVDKDDLPEGEHYIEIEVTGTKNGASSGAFILVDNFEILPVAA